MSNSATINELPVVAAIQGAMFFPARTPRESRVVIQYFDKDGVWHQLAMPFLDAMYLLNVLKGIQLDSGFRMPDDSRQPDRGA